MQVRRDLDLRRPADSPCTQPSPHESPNETWQRYSPHLGSQGDGQIIELAPTRPIGTIAR
eukprot:2180753-Pyramimonas_sp.AAC.1